MIESATNKLLHTPTTRLRTSAGAGEADDLVRAAQHLFDLPAPPPAEPSSPIAARTDDENEERLPH
jgi:hypothetical protein